MEINGIRVPSLLYGTAWKEDRTEELVSQALAQGFRGIDTANQRKHYFEAGVGAAISKGMGAGLVNRDDLFLQTKFTFRGGQDKRLPYDPGAPVEQQVRQSFTSSLEHLGVKRIDSYVLHGPSQSNGLGHDDWSAWRAIESLYREGGTSFIGISNVSLSQLKLLCERADVVPHFVQNRCYAILGWDREVRAFCKERGIVYQGFSLLTANHDVVNSRAVQEIARRHSRTPAQVVFRFAADVGMLPLTGTTSVTHMQDDLNVSEFNLDPAEVGLIERLAQR